jgi:putative CocE/NonD family hydrolase
MATEPALTGSGRILQNVKVPMRDGVRLEATVHLPREAAPCPAVLVRTAYNRMWGGLDDFLARGMAVVLQDVRGRYGSEGRWVPFVNETRDGVDTLNWIAAQPWCNGRIAMFGDSYLAATQLAVAGAHHPNLVALNPRHMCVDMWQHAYYFDGVFSLALTWSWLVFEVSSRSSNAVHLPLFRLERLLRELPLLRLDVKSGFPPVPAYRQYTSRWRYGKFWRDRSFRPHLARADVPLLLTAGWYDYYAGEAFEAYRILLEHAKDPLLARRHRVLVGPWTHGMPGATSLGQLDFGPASLAENDSTLRWLDCMLHGRGAETFQPAPIRLFVMGANAWRDEQEWPLARTRWTKFYLHSRGGAARLPSDGTLSTEAPGRETPDSYTYDPEDPAPTLGGNHSVGPYNPGLYEMARPGPFDQRPLERRDDVLTYTTPVLDEDVEVTGPVRLRLFASSSARDTDFTAKLCDVYPDGRSMNIAEGVLRARFRERRWEAPRLMKPGTVYEFPIDLQATSNVFRRGHHIRLDIGSSNFPLWDRNLNTGNDPATDTEMRRARQTIHHDAAHPSHLILPVIPAKREERARPFSGKRASQSPLTHGQTPPLWT